MNPIIVERNIRLKKGMSFRMDYGSYHVRYKVMSDPDERGFVQVQRTDMAAPFGAIEKELIRSPFFVLEKSTIL